MNNSSKWQRELCQTQSSQNPNPIWKITQKGTIVKIAYGSDPNFVQYAALHLKSSYFRLNYGAGSGWGTSVVLLPSFWEQGKSNSPRQGGTISASYTYDINNLIISFAGTISSLRVQGRILLFPPAENSISAIVTVTNVDGDISLENRPGEAFKPVMLSSMHISNNWWDTQSVYVGSQTYSIPQSEWIIQPPITESIFGLIGGTSDWKTNAPTIEITLDQSRPITGWVTLSDDPNDDNLGIWAASDQVMRSWEYSILVKSIPS